MAEENFVDPLQESDPKDRFKLLRNLIGVFLVVALLISAFWFSFLLGKRMLTPVKTLPQEEEVVVVKEEEVAKEVLGTAEVQAEVQAFRPAQDLPQTVASKAVCRPKTKAAAAKKEGFPYRVQAGFFRQQENAQQLSADLKANGFDNLIKKLSSGFYRVQVGAFKTRAEAQKLVESLRSKNFEAIIVSQ